MFRSHIFKLSFVMVALVFSGCGEVSPKSKTSPNSSVTNNQVLSGDINLSVISALEVAAVADTQPKAGQTFVLVDLKLKNGLEEPFPVGYDHFRLKTEGNLEHSASTLSGSLTPSCPLDAQLSSGAISTCQLAFEIPKGTVPTTLVFETPTEDIEQVVFFETCTECDGRCVDLMTDDSHCGGCSTPVPADSRCVDGLVQCAPGGYLCAGTCLSDTEICSLDVEIRISCTDYCGGFSMSCKKADYFYQCGDEGISDRDADCAETPPDNCTDYYVLCECGT